MLTLEELWALKYRVLSINASSEWIPLIEELIRLSEEPTVELPWLPSNPNEFEWYFRHPLLWSVWLERQSLVNNRRAVLQRLIETKFLAEPVPHPGDMAAEGGGEQEGDLLQYPVLVQEVSQLRQDVDALIAAFGQQGELAAFSSSIKPHITIWAEENGALNHNHYEWSFGNGGEGNNKYGFCLLVAGKIKAGSLSATAGNAQAAECAVQVVVNGSEVAGYTLTKPTNTWGRHTTFAVPLVVEAGDILNFRSKTSNSSVTHAIVALLVELTEDYNSNAGEDDLNNS